MRNLAWLVIAMLSCIGTMHAQSAMHTQFLQRCDSIDNFVRSTYTEYSASVQSKMMYALQKKCAADLVSAQVVNNYFIPYAVLAVLPSNKLESKLAQQYNIQSWPVTIELTSNPRIILIDSMMYVAILQEYSSAIFDESSVTKKTSVKQNATKAPQQSNRSQTANSKNKPTNSAPSSSPVSSSGQNYDAPTLPTIYRIAEISPYLQRKFALDQSKITERDFAILYFNAMGKLTRCVLHTVDEAEVQGKRQSTYLAAKEASFVALAKKLGWRGPRQHGKFVEKIVALSLTDYTMKILE
jgi:hypothetical protein